AYVLREGTDLTLLGTGTATYHALHAAEILAQDGISAEVLHVPTIKPLDEETILPSPRKTNRAVTIEEAQIAGGFGAAVAELSTLHHPVRLLRLGMKDRFGETGAPKELLAHFRLTGPHIAEDVQAVLAAEGARS